MYCKECGKQLADDSKFCRYCGTKQDHENWPVVESIISDDPKDINVNISFGKRVKSDTGKKEPEIKPAKPKYDESYENEIGATITGSIVIALNLIVLFTRSYSGQSSSNEFYPIFSIINLIWRIIVTVWVVNIAGRQNRSTGGWGVFTFFMPNLALIIIGLLKKLRGDDTVVPDSLNIEPENTDKTEYKVINELEGSAISTGKYIEYYVRFDDGLEGKYYFFIRKNNFSFATADETLYFSKKEACIIELHKYLKNKEH